MPLLGHEKYSPEKMEKLSNYVQVYAQKGKPVEYEILVDGFKAVRRTNDPEEFNMYEGFIGGDSKVIEVLFFTGASNNNDKYIFNLKEDPKENGLSGLEVDKRIQESVNKAKELWEMDQLKKDNADLKEYVEELEEENEKLENALIEAKSEKSPLQGILGEFGSSFLESWVRRNPKVLEKLPIGKALSGFLDQNEGASQEETQESEVSFKSKKSEINSEAEDALSLVRHLKENLNEEEYTKLMQIIGLLVQDSKRIDNVISYLTGKRK